VGGVEAAQVVMRVEAGVGRVAEVGRLQLGCEEVLRGMMRGVKAGSSRGELTLSLKHFSGLMVPVSLRHD